MSKGNFDKIVFIYSIINHNSEKRTKDAASFAEYIAGRILFWRRGPGLFVYIFVKETTFTFFAGWVFKGRLISRIGTVILNNINVCYFRFLSNIHRISGQKSSSQDEILPSGIFTAITFLTGNCSNMFLDCIDSKEI